MKVRDLMTLQFQIVREEDSLLQAVRRLRECPQVEDELGIKSVIVLDGEDRLRGVLTQSDVVDEVLFPYFVRDLSGLSGEDREFRAGDFEALAVWAAKVQVKDVMTYQPTTVSPDADAFEAADLLTSKRIKSLPVIEEGKVIGILYRSALYRYMASSILACAPDTETVEG